MELKSKLSKTSKKRDISKKSRNKQKTGSFAIFDTWLQCGALFSFYRGFFYSKFLFYQDWKLMYWFKK